MHRYVKAKPDITWHNGLGSFSCHSEWKLLDQVILTDTPENFVSKTDVNYFFIFNIL